MKTKHGGRGKSAGGTMSGVLWTLLFCVVMAVAFIKSRTPTAPDPVVASESLEPPTPEPAATPIPAPPEAAPIPAPELVVAPPVPATPAPLEIASVVVNPSLWPPQVALVRAWPFPIVISGRAAGQATAPVGTALRVFRVGAQQIEVEFQGARHLVPLEATDLMARAEAAFRREVAAPPAAADPARMLATAALSEGAPTAPVAEGAPIVTSRSVFIDGAETAGDSTTTNHWRSYSGSYSKTRTASRDLTITVRNMAAIPGEFTVEWFFVGKPVNGTNRFLYDKGEKQVSLAAGAFDKFVVESKELSSRNVRDTGYYYYYGYSFKSGDRPDGWIMRAKVGDEVIRVKASNAQLEQLVKNKEEFARFVEKQK